MLHFHYKQQTDLSILKANPLQNIRDISWRFKDFFIGMVFISIFCVQFISKKKSWNFREWSSISVCFPIFVLTTFYMFEL